MQNALLKKCNLVKNKHWKHNAIVLEFHHTLGYLPGVSSSLSSGLILSYEVDPANQSPLTFSWNLNLNGILHQRSWLLFLEIQVGPLSLCLDCVSGMGRLTTLRKINGQSFCGFLPWPCQIQFWQSGNVFWFLSPCRLYFVYIGQNMALNFSQGISICSERLRVGCQISIVHEVHPALSQFL